MTEDPMRLPGRHPAGTIWLAAAVLLAVALTACASASGDSGIASANGGTSQPSASASPDNASLTDAQRVRKFAQCMRDQGIDVSESSADGHSSIRVRGGNRAKMEAAMRACQKYAPGSGGESRRLDPQALAQARRFSKCMRDHGVAEFPDPDPNGGIRIEAKKGSGLTPDDPTFQNAHEACGSLMGGPRPRKTMDSEGPGGASLETS
jgi:hypothetical protein